MTHLAMCHFLKAYFFPFFVAFLAFFATFFAFFLAAIFLCSGLKEKLIDYPENLFNL
jgi:predicted Na+-dependent transporter